MTERLEGLYRAQPGEHPRLFFRKADLPKLRARAATPDGLKIIDRCKYPLDGAEIVREAKAFTLWDGTAFGFLYPITPRVPRGLSVHGQPPP